MTTIPPAKQSTSTADGKEEKYSRPVRKRLRSESLTSEELPQMDQDLLQKIRPPPTAYELDRIHYHIGLQEFGSRLQNVANAIFPGNQESRYYRVEVLLLCWQDEDPKLPVSVEIDQLADVFSNIYGYHVQKWLIPSQNCHNRLQVKILEFLGPDDPDALKIVFYAGHAKLTNHGQLAWTSLLDSKKDRCPTVKWSGIQNTLEESQSDILVLLDCCAAGTCTSDEGNGVTELIAACPHNATANGVGRFSFTHALVNKLRSLASFSHFTIAYLYNALFTEIQNWRFEDSRHKMVPIHLVVSQNNQKPRSIRLPNLKLCSYYRSKGSKAVDKTLKTCPKPPSSHKLAQKLSPFFSGALQEQPESKTILDGVAESKRSPPVVSPGNCDIPMPEYPRLLFSVRLDEDVKPTDLSIDLFADWLRDVPVPASLVRIEAGFSSDSTLLMLSMPAGALAYLASNPAIILLGTVRSRNLIANDKTDCHPIANTVGVIAEGTRNKVVGQMQDLQNIQRSNEARSAFRQGNKALTRESSISSVCSQKALLGSERDPIRDSQASVGNIDEGSVNTATEMPVQRRQSTGDRLTPLSPNWETDHYEEETEPRGVPRERSQKAPHRAQYDGYPKIVSTGPSQTTGSSYDKQQSMFFQLTGGIIYPDANYASEISIEDEQPQALEAFQSYTAHIHSQKAASNCDERQSTYLADERHSPCIQRWSAEDSPEERIRLGLPRWKSEEHRRNAYEQNDV